MEKAGRDGLRIARDIHRCAYHSAGRTGPHGHRRQILIATGGRPAGHPALPGNEYCISSNEAFYLEKLPKSILIEGGGYIAVEFANIFHGLGVDVTLVYRGAEILSRFDHDLRRLLHEAMEKKGIHILCQTIQREGRETADGKLESHLSDDTTRVVDQMMLDPWTQAKHRRVWGLKRRGWRLGALGEIIVDDYSRTNIRNIWAVGDVTNRVQLTPVAIHEAMCFVETAFKNNPTEPDHQVVATAVFSQPEIGTVGLTEKRPPSASTMSNLSRALPADAQHPGRPRRKNADEARCRR